MAITLDTVRTNKTIRTIAAYVQQYTDEHYEEQWQQEYEELLPAWKKSGERSYTLHLHKFFTPLQKDLEQIGLKFAQGLRGVGGFPDGQWCEGLGIVLETRAREHYPVSKNR